MIHCTYLAQKHYTTRGLSLSYTMNSFNYFITLFSIFFKNHSSFCKFIQNLKCSEIGWVHKQRIQLWGVCHFSLGTETKINIVQINVRKNFLNTISQISTPSIFFLGFLTKNLKWMGKICKFSSFYDFSKFSRLWHEENGRLEKFYDLWSSK